MTMEKQYPIQSELIRVLDNKIWILCSMANILLSIDCISGEQKTYIIPFEDYIGSFYADMIAKDGNIFLVPGSTQRFVKFEISSGKFTGLPYNSGRQNYDKWLFCNGILQNGKVYCFPREGDFRMVQVKDMTFVKEDFFQKIHYQEALYNYYYVAQSNEKIFAFQLGHPGIMIMNMLGMKRYILENEFPPIIEGYAIYLYNGLLYIFNHISGNLYFVDTEQEKIVKIINLGVNVTGAIGFSTDKYFCFDCYCQPEVYVFDMEGSIVKVLLSESILPIKHSLCYGAWNVSTNGTIVWYNNSSGKLLIYDDIMTSPNTIYHPQISSKDIRNLSFYSRHKGVRSEDNFYNLKGFIEVVFKSNNSI